MECPPSARLVMLTWVDVARAGGDLRSSTAEAKSKHVRRGGPEGPPRAACDRSAIRAWSPILRVPSLSDPAQVGGQQAEGSAAGTSYQLTVPPASAGRWLEPTAPNGRLRAEGRADQDRMY